MDKESCSMTPLKRLLFERELKNKFLVDRCGTDDTTISQIVNGKRMPSLIMAIKIAKALEVSVEELWGYLLEGK